MKVILLGWNKGMKKISLTRLLQEACSMSISTADSTVRSILDEKSVALEFADRSAGMDFARKAEALGARIEMEGASSPSSEQ